MELEKEYLYKSFKELRVKYFAEVVDAGLKDQDPRQQVQTVKLLKKCCEKEKHERKSSQIASKIK